MKINAETAMRLWTEHYGSAYFARDFHGRMMCRDDYGTSHRYYLGDRGERISCGWNIHHILPVACGGTDEKHNLICTSIATNEAAGDKITYRIDDALYQVRRIRGTREHEIVKLI